MRLGVFLIFLICLFGSEWVRAESNYSQNTVSKMLLAISDSEIERPHISKQKAASKAKHAYPGNKILSIKLIKSSGPAVYRLKMLSSKGVVKYVFVDGKTGSVFE